MINIDKVSNSITPIIKKSDNKITSNVQPQTQELAPAVDSYGRAIVEKRILGTYDIDKLPFINSKKMESFEQIAPDKLLFVHLTDYLPKNGVIQSDFTSTGAPRNTVHFALNHSVVNPLGAGGTKGWTEKKYAVIAPFNKTCSANSPIGGKYNDFMFEGNVTLPEGSFIYMQNPEIPQGKVKFFDAFELTGRHDITLIEGSETPYNMGDDLIEKLGYTNLKDLHAEMIGQTRDAVNFANDIENIVNLSKKLFLGEISEEEFSKIFPDFDPEKIAENAEKNIEKERMWSATWNKFIKSLNLPDVIHSETPYSDLENIVELIDLLHVTGSKWQSKELDYQSVILKKIDTMIKNPDFKLKFINLDELKSVIQNAKTPIEAMQVIKERFGINNFQEYSDLSASEIPAIIEDLTGKLTHIEKYPEIEFNWNF